jgi:hypothetical protein
VIEPGDILRAWRDVIVQLRSASSSVVGESELARKLFTPMRLQAELFEQALTQQAELQDETVRRLVAPMNALVDVLDQAVTSFRAQAKALEAAASSFAQAAALMEKQASLTETARDAFRGPLGLLPSARERTDDSGEGSSP